MTFTSRLLHPEERALVTHSIEASVRPPPSPLPQRQSGRFGEQTSCPCRKLNQESSDVETAYESLRWLSYTRFLLSLYLLHQFFNSALDVSQWSALSPACCTPEQWESVQLHCRQGGFQSLSEFFREGKNWLHLTFMEQKAMTTTQRKGLHCHNQPCTSMNCWALSCIGTDQRSWTGNDMLTVDNGQREFTQISAETINVPYCRVFKRRNISTLTQIAFYETYGCTSASNKPV